MTWRHGGCGGVRWVCAGTALTDCGRLTQQMPSLAYAAWMRYNFADALDYGMFDLAAATATSPFQPWLQNTMDLRRPGWSLFNGRLVLFGG